MKDLVIIIGASNVNVNIDGGLCISHVVKRVTRRESRPKDWLQDAETRSRNHKKREVVGDCQNRLRGGGIVAVASVRVRFAGKEW
jgi:hypothetical protein